MDPLETQSSAASRPDTMVPQHCTSQRFVAMYCRLEFWSDPSDAELPQKGWLEWGGEAKPPAALAIMDWHEIQRYVTDICRQRGLVVVLV